MTPYPLVNILLNTLPATACANPPVLSALLAKLVAWLNLSHLEKATVFVMVRASAITDAVLAPWLCLASKRLTLVSLESPGRSRCRGWGAALTDKNQANKFKIHDRQNRHANPKRRLRIHCQPEESLVRSVDCARLRVRALKDPSRVTGRVRRGINLVPPSQSH